MHTDFCLAAAVESFCVAQRKHALSPLLFPPACPDSCLMQCPLVRYQKNTSVVSAPMPQRRMPSGCHLCLWAWTLPLQPPQQPLTTTPATYPTLPSHRTGNPHRFVVTYLFYSSLFTLRVCGKLAFMSLSSTLTNFMFYFSCYKVVVW